MKIRNGFVSNSSSSSFIITAKKVLTREDLSIVLVKKFKVSKEHALFPFVDSIADVLLEHSKKYTNVEKYIKDVYIEDLHVPDEYRKLWDEGKIIYIGSVPNYGDGGNALESVICDMAFEIKTKDFRLSKRNRY